MRNRIILVLMLLCSATSALAQLSIGIGMPGVSIGINLPMYPQLARVPGYPVYYAPGLNLNFFFYDGLYWVFQDDRWYASSWYNGPWGLVGPERVPLYVLRIPVRYYRQPPRYFSGWRPDAPPRWGEHWGNDWQRQRSGWDQWNRRAAPAPAPLPTYQRQYSGERYPQFEQQRDLSRRNYRYQPRDEVAREHLQQQAGPRPGATSRPPPPPQAAPQRQEQRPPQAAPQRQEQRQPQPPRQEGAQGRPPGSEREGPGRGRGQDQDQDPGRGHQGQGQGRGPGQGRDNERGK